MLDKIAHALTRKPKLVVIIAIALIFPSIIGYVSTPVNYDILSYLPQDLESTQGEKLLEDPFKAAATSMLIVEDMPAGYTADLTEKIKDIVGVTNVVGAADLAGAQIPTDMLPASAIKHFQTEDATMIVIQYSKPAASAVTMSAIQQIRELCNKQCFLAGFSVLIKDTKDLIDKELPVYVTAAVLLSLAAMMLTLESTILPLAFLGCIGLAIIYNMGTNIFLGDISYITKALAAVLQLSVTMDYSIFLYRRYEEERNNYDDHRDAMAVAVKAAFESLTGSSLTTIAGFLALCFMQFTLGLNVGLIMAKGVALGVLTVIFVLPSVLLLSDKITEKHRHRTLLPNTSRMNHFILHHKTLFILIFIVALIPAYYSQSHAGVYYKLDSSLPADTPSVVATNEMSKIFDTSTFHIALVSDDIKHTDMNEMEDRIKDVDGVTSIVSYHAFLGQGIPDFFVPDSIRDMLKQGGYQLIMINSSDEVASDQIATQIQDIKDIVSEYDSNAYITGEGAMTNDLITTTDTDFRVTNYITLGLIFLIVMFVFQSLTVPIVLIMNIELAIFINQGLGYFTGTTIPFIAPTMIGCIQMGATIDYAILMTTRFREEIRNGRSRMEAAHIAATTSDSSIITSALVMFVATLGVSFVSQIDLISSICVMLARGAIISAFVTMFILPSMIYAFEPLFAKTSLHWNTFPVKREHKKFKLALPSAKKK